MNGKAAPSRRKIAAVPGLIRDGRRSGRPGCGTEGRRGGGGVGRITPSVCPGICATMHPCDDQPAHPVRIVLAGRGMFLEKNCLSNRTWVKHVIVQDSNKFLCSIDLALLQNAGFALLERLHRFQYTRL